jgi:hypothetical protein
VVCEIELLAFDDRAVGRISQRVARMRAR